MFIGQNMKSSQNERIRSKYTKFLIFLVTLCCLISLCLGLYFGLTLRKTVHIKEVNKTIQFASIIFRHGDRTPTELYNSDPYKHYNWPGGLGALTNLGKRQLYNLGITIRGRYRNFLPDNYDDNDIYILSSDKSRTLMSAYSFLAGLYPPTSTQIWNTDINWQPIPVHTMPREMDKVLASKKPCIEYDNHKKQMLLSEEYQKLNNSLVDLYEFLTVKTNQTIDSISKIETLYNTLSIEKDVGLTLPKWTEGVLERMEPIAATSLSWVTFDDFMIRMKSGPLLSQIIDNMKKKTYLSDNFVQKMAIYSAHDVTVLNFMRALSFREMIMPDYGSALVLELHKTVEDSNPEVRFLYYNNTYVTEPYVLDIPKCKNPCLLSRFEEVSVDYIPIDWEKECGNV